MLKRISIIIVLGVFVLACDGSQRPKKPNDLMSKSQMTDFLYDLYVINAAKGVNKSALEKSGFNPESYIYEKHNIDSVRFANSNTYYTFDPEAYKAIIDEVKERLESEKLMFEDLKEKETDSMNRRKDSIKKRAKAQKDSIKKILDTTSFKNVIPKGL